jgi:hypothetical protein
MECNSSANARTIAVTRAGPTPWPITSQINTPALVSESGRKLKKSPPSQQRLADALVRHAHENDVVESEQTPHGTRHVVEGPLTAPDGTRLNVRSAWYINPGGGAPRFVTAHPLPKL